MREAWGPTQKLGPQPKVRTYGALFCRKGWATWRQSGTRGGCNYNAIRGQPNWALNVLTKILPSEQVWANYVNLLQFKDRLRAKKTLRHLFSHLPRGKQDAILSYILKPQQPHSREEKGFEKLPDLKKGGGIALKLGVSLTGASP